MKNLSSGDMILVGYESSIKKAKFLRSKEDGSKMQVTVIGKTVWIPCTDFIMSSWKDPEGKKVTEVKILVEAYTKLIASEKTNPGAVAIVGKEHNWKAVEIHKLHGILTNPPKLVKEGEMKVEKGRKAKEKPQKEPKAPKKEKVEVNISELAKSYEKIGKASPSEFQEMNELTKTNAIAVMLLAGEDPKMIKESLGLTILQFVYNVRTKLIKDGLVYKPEKKKKSEDPKKEVKAKTKESTDAPIAIFKIAAEKK